MPEPKHNLDALLIGTGEFSFAEGATSAANARAKGYRDFGNVRAVNPATELKSEGHFGSYRGKRNRDKQIAIEHTLEYKLKFEEWTPDNVAVMLGGGPVTNYTLPGVDITDPLSFVAWGKTVTLNPRLWYPIATVNGGFQFYNLRVGDPTLGNDSLALLVYDAGNNAVDELVFTERWYDLEVDWVLGRVRFKQAAIDYITTTWGAGSYVRPALTIDADLTPEEPWLPVPAMQKFTPMLTAVRKGYGRLIIFDQHDTNKVVFEHVDFSCELNPESPDEVDGQKVTGGTVNVLITSDVGKVLTRTPNQ